MTMTQSELFHRRKRRVRASIRRNAVGRLRLTIHRSGQHIYAQVIDDANGITLASASTVGTENGKSFTKTATIEAAKAVGAMIAERARQANVTRVVFDRGGYLFHGRVKALADAARAAGLEF